MLSKPKNDTSPMENQKSELENLLIKAIEEFVEFRNEWSAEARMTFKRID